jgi:hypothetical protein
MIYLHRLTELCPMEKRKIGREDFEIFLKGEKDITSYRGGFCFCTIVNMPE